MSALKQSKRMFDKKLVKVISNHLCCEYTDKGDQITLSLWSHADYMILSGVCLDLCPMTGIRARSMDSFVITVDLRWDSSKIISLVAQPRRLESDQPRGQFISPISQTGIR